MKSLAGKVAAITGAGSGIGRATAALLARHGCHLALSDVDSAGLAQTLKDCSGSGVQISATLVDVADREAMHGWADLCVRQHDKVNLILNNAGVSVAASVEGIRYEDFDWIMGINFWGVVHGTKAFLPHIKRAGEGAIVNVSSVFGFIGIPGQSSYNASKFAVRGFTEALRAELDIEGTGIGVTCVHPGGIRTNIARNARVTEHEGLIDERSTLEFEKVLRTSSETAAKSIVHGILKNQRRVLIGVDAVAIDLMQRFMPTGYQAAIAAGGRLRKRQMLPKAGKALTP
ncbi:MAG: SDR family oxidoreductase [Myxococcales bacterium]